MLATLTQGIIRATVDVALRLPLLENLDRAREQWALTAEERAGLLCGAPYPPTVLRLESRVTAHHHHGLPGPGADFPDGPWA